MKNQIVKIFYLSILLILFSNCNHEMTMVAINIEILTNKNLAKDSIEDLPPLISTFLKPIEIGDTVFIPSITVNRVDLPAERPFTIIIQKETANKIRAYFGIYSYTDYKSDYNNFEPKLRAGNYLSQVGNKDTLVNTLSIDTFEIINSNDATRAYDLIKNNLKTISGYYTKNLKILIRDEIKTIEVDSITEVTNIVEPSPPAVLKIIPVIPKVNCKILRISNNELTFNISNLPKGTYDIELSENDFSVSYPNINVISSKDPIKVNFLKLYSTPPSVSIRRIHNKNSGEVFLCVYN